MNVTLFHGSKDIIKTPVFGFGKTYNDYGLGFYCTETEDMAKEWAVDKGRNGYANCYELDCTGLRLLDISATDFCILHWLTILLENREFDMPSGLAFEAKEYLLSNFSIPYKSYDIITGYRADDSYFSFAQDFLNGTISYRQLSEAMHLEKLGMQFVLKSRDSFERIKFLKADPVYSKEWLNKKLLRDSNARRDYLDTRKNKRQPGDIYITHILDERIIADDPRLR